MDYRICRSCVSVPPPTTRISVSLSRPRISVRRRSRTGDGGPPGPHRELGLFGTYAYLDTAVADFTIGGVDPTAITGNSDDLRQAPENKYSLGGVIDFPLPGGSMISLRADYYDTDEQSMITSTRTQSLMSLISLTHACHGPPPAATGIEVAVGQEPHGRGLHLPQLCHCPGVIGVWGAPALYGVAVSYEM